MSVSPAVEESRLVTAARALHGHIQREHLHDGRLAGADQGIRWNIRIGRFLKSYLPSLRPVERFYFLQGQGYWVLASRTLADLTGEPSFAAAAREAARVVGGTQRPDGAWDYPLPERRHLIATVEGDFGAVAMLEEFEREGDPAMLAAALRWHQYLETHIGYQQHPAGLCVNYFQKPRGMVPNNTCEWIWVLGRFARATGDDRFLDRVPAMLSFLEAVQYDSGELPYELPGPHEPRHQPHYLCFQYNAFQCMKLAWFAQQTGDGRARGLAVRLAAFLATGVRESGSVRASCASAHPEVLYYADAVAMALHTVSACGWADHAALADRAYRWVLSHQLARGDFAFFSRRDYGVLTDRNAYPRYLAMTLFHLAERARDPRPLS